MDILDVDPNPTECMVNLSSFFKFLFLDTHSFQMLVSSSSSYHFVYEEKAAELTHIPLVFRSQCFPSTEQIPSFSKDLFDNRLRLDRS